MTIACMRHENEGAIYREAEASRACQPTCFVSLLRAQMTMMSAKVALPIQRFRPFSTQPPST